MEELGLVLLVDPNSVLHRVNQLKYDLAAIETRTSNHQSFNIARNATWECLPIGFCKINWDVAVDRLNFTIGIGVAVRDEKGDFLATMRKKKLLNPDPLIAKATGTLIAVNFGIELGMRKVVLKRDSKRVVMAIQKQVTDESYFGGDHIIY